MPHAVPLAVVVVALMAWAPLASGAELSIERFGAVPDSTAAAAANRLAVTWALGNCSAGDIAVVPAGKNFFCLGGITGANATDVTLRVDGRLTALPDFRNWPRTSNNASYLNFLDLQNMQGLTITSSSERGVIDGRGLPWWNAVILGTLGDSERPRLVSIEDSSRVLVERLHLMDSPSYHFIATGVSEIEVRFVDVSVNRTAQRALKAMMRARRGPAGGLPAQAGPFPPLEPEDLNTDGIDVAGSNVWVHDCVIANDDDSIAVKPSARPFCSENMLFERLTLTGFGASIGSVPPHSPPNCVRNITIRNVTMPGTGKGIYVKSNPDCDHPDKSASITDVLYEDVRIVDPVWWAVWIGPQQQHEPHEQLGTKCALDYPIDPHCPTQGCVTFTNITLRRVTIVNPLLSPGVVLGNASNPMQGIVFEDVIVTGGNGVPFGHGYKCENVHAVSAGATSPPLLCNNTAP